MNAADKTRSEATIIVNGRAIACVVWLDGVRWRVRAQVVVGDRPAAALWRWLESTAPAELETIAGIALHAFATSLEEAQARAFGMAQRLGYMHLAERDERRSNRRAGWA